MGERAAGPPHARRKLDSPSSRISHFNHQASSTSNIADLITECCTSAADLAFINICPETDSCRYPSDEALAKAFPWTPVKLSVAFPNGIPDEAIAHEIKQDLRFGVRWCRITAAMTTASVVTPGVINSIYPCSETWTVLVLTAASASRLPTDPQRGRQEFARIDESKIVE